MDTNKTVSFFLVEFFGLVMHVLFLVGNVFYFWTAVSISLQRDTLSAVVRRASRVAAANQAPTALILLPKCALVADLHGSVGVRVAVANRATTVAVLAEEARGFAGLPAAQIQVFVVSSHFCRPKPTHTTQRKR